MRRILCQFKQHNQKPLYSMVDEKFGHFIVRTKVVCECSAEWWE